MNKPIIRLFMLIVLLFAVLIGYTSRWTVFQADELRAETTNKRDELAQLRIKRGVIRSSDGVVLARSIEGRERTYTRRYSNGDLVGNIIGYSDVDNGTTGLEESRNAELSGERDAISTVLKQLKGDVRIGDNIVSTLDLKAQRVAMQGLKGRKGAVVAMEPRTGRIRVMASFPSFDPNEVVSGDGLTRINKDPDAPQLNRATQPTSYPPGSTFKVVTAAAALDSGRFSPTSVVNGNSPKTISGTTLQNFGNESLGDVDLTTALTKSVNTVWAQVGERVGRSRMQEYMERFGFYEPPDVDFPRVVSSGVRSRRGRLVKVTSDRVDLGRVSIGQGDLGATPLQMATVAAVVANGGVRMKPTLTERVVDQDGRTVDRIEPESEGRVISRQTARELTVMMKNVVREGTGTAAALSGVDVAGKTGTAEINIATRLNQPWFIGFTPDMAVAVTIERVTGGSGGTDAAPIAKAVLEALGQ